MPYVVGTYRDKIGAMNCLLDSQNLTLTDCRQAIRWQVGPGHTGLPCMDPKVEKDLRTSWHVADPVPASAFSMVCRDCGAQLHISRGAFTWEAFHKIVREIWGDLVPLTVAELRLSSSEH